MKLGIEIGGTFAALVCIDSAGVRVTKVASTPRRRDEGAFAALDAVRTAPATIAELAHASTVATNTVLERKGVRLAAVARCHAATR